jgi:signal transduction histidine kinase
MLREVSCKAFDLWFQAIKVKGLPAEALVAGTPCTVAQLTAKDEWVDWKVLAAVMANAARIWTPEEVVELGRRVLPPPPGRFVAGVGRALFTAPEFFRLMSSRRKAANDLFTCVVPRLEELGADRLRITMTLPDGYARPREFFLVSQGTFSELPRLLGLPRADVELRLTETGATYELTVPPGGGLLGRVVRFFTRPFAARAQTRELKDAYSALQNQFHELDQARDTLAAQAEQLQTVNLLGRELTRFTDLPLLASAVDQLLRDRIGATRVGLWLVLVEGEAEQRVHQTTEAADAPASSLTLASASRRLGRIDVWGVAKGGPGATLLEALVPWLSIAFENARLFRRQQEHQAELERTVADRTIELRRSLRQATEADRLKSEFFANASHELRTPLTLMLVPLESLLQAEALAPESRKELESVLRAGYRLLKLINDVLELAKAESGGLRLRRAPTDLSRIVEVCAHAWQPAEVGRNVTLELDVAASLPLVADGERLAKVVLNLIANAVKNSADGGTVWLKAHPVEDGVKLSVAREGPSLDPADLARLFDRFAQAAGSGAPAYSTSGLGLAVARELVELHDGRIGVENREGNRVVFEVWLPAGAAAPAPAPLGVPTLERTEVLQYALSSAQDTSPAAEDQARSDKPLLLVAEDSADLRKSLARCLSEDFQLLEAADGEEALALARERLPDLILSDVMMPRMDGFELCREVKADPATMGIPVVLLTARIDIEDRVEGFRGGADDYVVKPFHPEELRARLRSQLRMRRLSEQVAHSEKLAALGTLVAGVAHEVRNPLNGLINSLGPLKEALVGASPEISELLDLAIESSKQVDHVSGQLLQQAHVGTARRLEVDVRANLALALQMLSHKMMGGPAVATVLPEDHDVLVMGDPGSLHQVWINLVENAIHAAGAKGKVQVSLARTADQVCVEVADDGPGIEARLLKRIFDPFFTTKAVGQGTGLGLSLVREIVRKHEGTITVDSRLGAGARFKVTLPAANRAAKSAEHVRERNL